MTRSAVLLCVLITTACTGSSDRGPEPVGHAAADAEPKSGVTVSGSATIGYVKGN